MFILARVVDYASPGIQSVCATCTHIFTIHRVPETNQDIISRAREKLNLSNLFI